MCAPAHGAAGPVVETAYGCVDYFFGEGRGVRKTVQLARASVAIVVFIGEYRVCIEGEIYVGRWNSLFGENPDCLGEELGLKKWDRRVTGSTTVDG